MFNLSVWWHVKYLCSHRLLKFVVNSVTIGRLRSMMRQLHDAVSIYVNRKKFILNLITVITVQSLFRKLADNFVRSNHALSAIRWTTMTILTS